jgi:CubicO group peptidase (beta-lactamase class C family)
MHRRAFLALAAAGLEAQTPAAAYYPPAEVRGGWRSLVEANSPATPAQAAKVREACGMDWERLGKAWEYCRNFEGDNRLLVIRRGWIVGEWYVEQTPQSVASCTKSLTGLAMAKLLDLSDAGALKRTIGLEDPAHGFLPGSWRRRDRRRAEVKIRHLLTMCSGLDPYDGPYRDLKAYAKTVVSRRVEAAPEEVWAYSSTSVDLLSLILQRVSRRKLGDFFNEEIGRPIGAAPIEFPEFEGHSGASGGPGGGAKVAPRELARIGYLVLRGGMWEGGRVVLSRERLRQFTSWAPFLEGSRFREPNFWVTQPGSQNYYGYLFWTNRTGEALGEAVPRDACYMSGFSMRTCIVAPSLDLVVVRQGNDREANKHVDFYRQLMARVMAAMEG